MKFPRNSRLLRNPFDMAPLAAVFFLLVIFMLLTALLPTPGVPLRLPVAGDLPGTDKPTVAVAVDAVTVANPATGTPTTLIRYYFANQIVSESQLTTSLRAAARGSPTPLTLVIHADKAVTCEQLVHLTLLAREAGIQNALLATLPRVINAPVRP